jgi:DNA-binding NarL/FixJ family response regulator
MTEDIDQAATRIATEIINMTRGENPAHIMAALTAGIAVYVANATTSADEAEMMIDAIAAKMKRVAVRHRADIGQFRQ